MRLPAFSTFLPKAHASARYRAKAALRGRAVRALLATRSRLRGFPADGSATVVVVNWNTLENLAVCLYALQRFASPAMRVLVVDNGSTDGSRRFLRRQRGVRSILLPLNIDHGPALDLGFLLATTEFVVALDADAFPIAVSWLATLLEPLDLGSQVSGVRVHRSYAHPCAMAMRRERFVRSAHTFRARWRRGGEGLGSTAWDCGELISMREEPRVALFERTGSLGPGWIGTWWEGLVYHNFYGRELGSPRPKEHGLANGAELRDPSRAWKVAVSRFLGLGEAECASLMLATSRYPQVSRPQ